MCGISGIISYTKGYDLLLSVNLMNNCMSHRGPDSDGIFCTPDNYLAFGHRRLSIIDLSHLGCQPLTDFTDRFVLVFNGEIYNYKEIRDVLSDYPFISNSDSEVLIAAFNKWGIECVSKLKGMFSFAVWDKVEEITYVVRDRMGVKPLYYFNNNDFFIFASEIRGILASQLIPRKLSKKGLYEYLSFQSTGVPTTIIEDVYQVNPGCYLRIRGSNVTEVRYWNMVSEHPTYDYGDVKGVKTNVSRLLHESIEKRMVSDVPIGAFLSGGIDSSIVVAIMSKLSVCRINTFTACFEEAQFDESPYAELVSKLYNTNHSNIKVKPIEFLDELHNALFAMDSPTGDGINTFVISKAIKSAGISVALSGLGGDELFAGYPTFSHWTKIQQYEKFWSKSLILRRLASFTLSFSNSGKVQRLIEILNQKNISVGNVYPTLRRVLSSKQLSHLLQEVDPFTSGFENQLLMNENEIKNFPLLSQMSIAELNGYTLNTLLKDTDQMSMAVSLEIREPFFDHDLVEFILNIPDHIKKSNYPKGLLIDSVNNLLPKEIISRKKQGFVFPWTTWLKNDLKDFGDKHIKAMSQRSFINGEALLNLWNRFQNHDKSVRWADLWLFIVLDFWLEYNQVNE